MEVVVTVVVYLNNERMTFKAAPPSSESLQRVAAVSRSPNLVMEPETNKSRILTI